MEVTLCSTYHGTQAKVWYTGGVFRVPEEVLDKLCPERWCTCLGTPYGFPRVIFTGGIQIDLDEDNNFVLKPGE